MQMLVPEGTNKGKREERSHETFEHKQDRFEGEPSAEQAAKEVRRACAPDFSNVVYPNLPCLSTSCFAAFSGSFWYWRLLEL